MKFLKDEWVVIGVLVLLAVFFNSLARFELEDRRAKHLVEAVAQGADPVAMSCAMGKKGACDAWAKREGK